MDSKKSVPCELTHLREDEIHIQPNLGHVLEQKAHWLAHGADSEELDDVGVVELGEEVGLLLEVHSHVLGCLFLWYKVVILGKDLHLRTELQLCDGTTLGRGEWTE